jgi:hypothetical protein
MLKKNSFKSEIEKTRMALSLAIKESKITITNTIQMMLWLQLPALDSIFLIYKCH